jgi:hypothetical protein
MIEPSIKDEFTQGVIFTSATASEYKTCDVFGLLITARCDFAHGKATCYNYIPIVPFEEWLKVDYLRLALKELEKDFYNTVKNIFKENEISETRLIVHELSSIVDTLFSASNNDRKMSTNRKKLTDIVDQIKKLNEISETVDFSLFKKKYGTSKICKKTISDCINNKLNGYYFLPKIEYRGKDTGYVALLREINSIPKILADKVRIGIEKPQFLELCSANPEVSGKLSFGSFDLCCTIGKLKSPTIEHFMQCFSLLFSRIGVKDPTPEYIAEMCEKLTR